MYRQYLQTIFLILYTRALCTCNSSSFRPPLSLLSDPTQYNGITIGHIGCVGRSSKVLRLLTIERGGYLLYLCFSASLPKTLRYFVDT
jgi:hypothetical protein